VNEIQPYQIRFIRKDFIDAIAYACQVLGLDVLEVNNKVYARAMDQLFAKISPRLRHKFVGLKDDWYEEVIELVH